MTNSSESPNQAFGAKFGHRPMRLPYLGPRWLRSKRYCDVRQWEAIVSHDAQGYWLELAYPPDARCSPSYYSIESETLSMLSTIQNSSCSSLLQEDVPPLTRFARVFFYCSYYSYLYLLSLFPSSIATFESLSASLLASR